MGWILIVLYVAYGAQVLGGLAFAGVLASLVSAAAMTPVADLLARLHRAHLVVGVVDFLRTEVWIVRYTCEW